MKNFKRLILLIIVSLFLCSAVHSAEQPSLHVSVDFTNTKIDTLLSALEKKLRLTVLYADGDIFQRTPVPSYVLSEAGLSVKFDGDLSVFLKTLSNLSGLAITLENNSIIIRNPIQLFFQALNFPEKVTVNIPHGLWNTSLAVRNSSLADVSVFFINSGSTLVVGKHTYHISLHNEKLPKNKLPENASGTIPKERLGTDLIFNGNDIHTEEGQLIQAVAVKYPIDSIITKQHKALIVKSAKDTYLYRIESGNGTIIYTKLSTATDYDYIVAMKSTGDSLTAQYGPLTFNKQLILGNTFVYEIATDYIFPVDIFWPRCNKYPGEKDGIISLVCNAPIDMSHVALQFKFLKETSNIAVCKSISNASCFIAKKAQIYGIFNEEWMIVSTPEYVGFINKDVIKESEADKKAEGLNTNFTAYEQPLSIVLASLFTGTDYTYLINNGADGMATVTIMAKNASLFNTLNEITSQVGFFWKRDGNTFVIYRDVDKMFTVGFPQLMQSFDVSSSQSRSSGGGGGSGGSGGSGGGSGGSGGGGGGGGLSSASLITAKAGGKKENMAALEKILDKFISPTGKVTFLKEMGTIYIHDRKNVVDQLEIFITGLNSELKKTLKIKGLITEVALNDAAKLGIDWSIVLNDVIKSAVKSDIGIGVSTTKMITDSIFALDSTFQWNSKTEKIYVKALENYGDVKIVSKPSISVANGSIGSLTVGDTVSYVSQAYTATAGTLGNGLTSSMTIEPLQIGLNFFVMPQILSDTEAILYISPDLTSLQEIRTISNNSVTVEAPHTTVKQTQTVVNVKNGQKLLISGMMSETDKKVKTGVPGLMNIPLLGNIFKTTSTEKTSSEFALMIEVSW